MKIRITDNTLRIRLSQSDLTDLSTLKPVTVSLPMGALEFTMTPIFTSIIIQSISPLHQTSYCLGLIPAKYVSQPHLLIQTIEHSTSSLKRILWVEQKNLVFLILRVSHGTR
jgi:hypothetical protein